MVAPVAGSKLQRLVDNDAAANRSSVNGKCIPPLLGNEMEFIRMVLLAEDEIPGEVSHQTDVAGHAKLQSHADLTKRSDVIIGNRINGQEFLLIGNVEACVGKERWAGILQGVHVFLIEKLIEGRATINKADTSGQIRRETPEWEAPRQCDQPATRKIGFCRQTKSFDADAKVSAPEIFHVHTAAPGVVSAEQLVLADLAEIDALIRIDRLRLAIEPSYVIKQKRV